MKEKKIARISGVVHQNNHFWLIGGTRYSSPYGVFDRNLHAMHIKLSHRIHFMDYEDVVISRLKRHLY